MQRSVDGEEDDEGGLKENPLYVSSQHEPEGSVYSVVNTNKKTKSKEKADESTIYTEVVKNQKKGCVYQNSGNLNQTEDVYANSEVKGNFGDKQVYAPTKNKDGLIYADLDLVPNMSGNRFVIRGLENRNNYAVIDLTKTAEPLPLESDSDDDDARAKTTKEEE
ncbi:uncharacterized protein LOC134723248 isoform X2 [Mytilus trossulus]|uniref:uncharacterized protein LOC134723248 isoform X2 n=1 Tax=Mytilus trossulus TaxID=6551 RepID=UPI003004E7DB